MSFYVFIQKKSKSKLKKKNCFFFSQGPIMKDKEKEKENYSPKKKKVYDFVVSGEIPFYLLVGWRGDQCEL